MFLVLFILGWILVHGATKGRYILTSPRNVKQEVAGIVLAVSLLCAMVGFVSGGDISFQAAGILAAITWFGILLMRTSLVDQAAQRAEEESLAAQAEAMRRARADRKAAQKVVDAVLQIPEPRSKDTPPDGKSPQQQSAGQGNSGQHSAPSAAPSAPVVKTVDRSWDGSARVAQNRQQDLQQRFELKQGKAASGPSEAAQADMKPQTPGYVQYVSGMEPLSGPVVEAPNVLHVELGPDSEQGYHSDVDQVMQIARETIGGMAGATHAVQPSQEATEPAIAEETPPPVVESASVPGPEPEPEFVPQQGWQAPKIEHARYELDNAGEKPVSIFGSGSSSTAGGQSLFSGGSQRPQRARAAPEVDRLLADNRLGNDEELTRPQAVLAGTDTPGAVESSAPQPPDDGKIVDAGAVLPDSELTRPKRVLEDAEKGQGPGFHYKPTEGIKSRF